MLLEEQGGRITPLSANTKQKWTTYVLIPLNNQTADLSLLTDAAAQKQNQVDCSEIVYGDFNFCELANMVSCDTPNSSWRLLNCWLLSSEKGETGWQLTIKVISDM
jgi:hypothetical protein